MKRLPLVAVLLAGALCGQEASAPDVKDKLRARIRETLPPLPVASLSGGKTEPAAPVLVLEPMTVSESRALRELGRELGSEKQRLEADSFSLLKGGKLYHSERLDLGIWWNIQNSGWEFLKLKW